MKSFLLLTFFMELHREAQNHQFRHSGENRNLKTEIQVGQGVAVFCDSLTNQLPQSPHMTRKTLNIWWFGTASITPCVATTWPRKKDLKGIFGR